MFTACSAFTDSKPELGGKLKQNNQNSKNYSLAEHCHSMGLVISVTWNSDDTS